MTRIALPFDNSYARLPDRFYARLEPTPVPAPRILRLNRALAAELGLDADALDTAAGAALLAGNDLPEGADPIAMAYAGHQFGGWVPQLGDGRAILLGELETPRGRVDLQLKGAGRTPFSRMGDGRAWVGPVLREYLVSEGMAALGVPTTRALAATATGETVAREAPFPGAVLARVAASHIRVGTFQYFAARRDADALRALADHAIARHYPDSAGAEIPALALLERVVAAQARLVAQWMGLGFIHGVMNTDNMSIAGETIDYGPCAFMDTYRPDTVFSSIDQFGRYAYSNQPLIAQWNLAQFASSLLPLIGEGEDALPPAQAAIDAFPALYEDAWAEVFRAKLGLAEAQDDDAALATDLLKAMETAQADFTLTFRALAETAPDAPLPAAIARDTAPLEAWRPRWAARLAAEGADLVRRQRAMMHANPAIIPRNHQVEAAIQAALAGDLAPFHALAQALARAWDAPADSPWRAPPAPDEAVTRTFCGT